MTEQKGRRGSILGLFQRELNVVTTKPSAEDAKRRCGYRRLQPIGVKLREPLHVLQVPRESKGSTLPIVLTKGLR